MSSDILPTQGPKQGRTKHKLWQWSISNSCHVADHGKGGALPGLDSWSPEACRSEDGGGGGRVVTADFPLRAEQTEVNYWKAEPASDSSHPRPSSQSQGSVAHAAGSLGRSLSAVYRSPSNPTKGLWQDLAPSITGVARAGEVLCFGQGCRWPNLPAATDLVLSPPSSALQQEPCGDTSPPCLGLARGAQTAGPHQVTPQLLLKVEQAGGAR